MLPQSKARPVAGRRLSGARSVPRELARLPGPLVPPDSAGEELDRLVDLFFDLRRHLADLIESEDSKCVQLVLPDWPGGVLGSSTRGAC